MNGYLAVLKKYAVFEGRARRKEYWMFTLVSTLITFGLVLLDSALGNEQMGYLTIIYVLVVFLPSLAVSVRRLHDTGRTGWWLLIGIIPLIGPLVLLVFNVQDSQDGTNAYGPNPKAVPA